MPDTSRCFLTKRDFDVLNAILRRRANLDAAFLRLLRRKLATATIRIGNAPPPDVATINSRVDFTIDGRFTDSRVLVPGDADATPGYTIAITRLRGLALLGLTAGETIMVDRPEGDREVVRLDAVAYQPEAALGDSVDRRPIPERTLRPCGGTRVVLFVPRGQRHSRPTDGGGDDPGPEAA